MCRLIIYKGRKIFIEDLLVKPENSLLCQSRDSSYHPGVDDEYNKRNILVNGDGFGLAWYSDIPNKGSCVVKMITPAWSDVNLLNLSKYIDSSLIFGHIRAAASGHDSMAEQIISTFNCHPFKYGRWTFMHNGGIAEFLKIKRQFCNIMDDKCYQGISGSTDSEHIFALFLSLLPSRDDYVSILDFTTTVHKTIIIVLNICKQNNIHGGCSLNLCFSDGINVVCTRFRDKDGDPPSLYYNYGSEFKCEKGIVFATSKEGTEIIITSAPLSKDEINWTLIPKNHMLVCVGDENNNAVVNDIYMQPIDLDNIEANIISKSISKSKLKCCEAVEICRVDNVDQQIEDELLGKVTKVVSLIEIGDNFI